MILISENIYSDRMISFYQDLSLLQVNDMIFNSTKIKSIENFINSDENLLFRIQLKIYKVIWNSFKYFYPQNKNVNQVSAIKRLSIDVNLKKKPIIYFLYYFLSVILKNSKIFRYIINKILRFLSIKLIKRVNSLNEILQKENDFIFFSYGNLTSILVSIIGSAANYYKKNTKVIILSWDNLTTKGYKTFEANQIAVWNNSNFQEAIYYQNQSKNDIFKIGSPIFDPKKRKFQTDNSEGNIVNVMYATKSPKSFPFNHVVIEILSLLSKHYKFNLKIRMHPLGLFNSDESKYDYEKILNLKKRYNFEIVSVSEYGKKFDLNSESEEYLDKVFLSSDLFISIFSTMHLESVYYDIPSINLSFEVVEEYLRNKRQHLYLDEIKVHNQRVHYEYDVINQARSISDLLDLFFSIFVDKDSTILHKNSNEFKKNECMEFNKKTFVNFLNA